MAFLVDSFMQYVWIKCLSAELRNACAETQSSSRHDSRPYKVEAVIEEGNNSFNMESMEVLYGEVYEVSLFIGVRLRSFTDSVCHLN